MSGRLHPLNSLLLKNHAQSQPVDIFPSKNMSSKGDLVYTLSGPYHMHSASRCSLYRPAWG